MITVYHFTELLPEFCILGIPVVTAISLTDFLFSADDDHTCRPFRDRNQLLSTSGLMLLMLDFYEIEFLGLKKKCNYKFLEDFGR